MPWRDQRSTALVCAALRSPPVSSGLGHTITLRQPATPDFATLPQSCGALRRSVRLSLNEQPVVKKEEVYGNDEKGQSTELFCPMGKPPGRCLRPTSGCI